VATVIGAITAPERGVHVREPNGDLKPLDAHGWDHLRPGATDAP
jgi:hypothetical protein